MLDSHGTQSDIFASVMEQASDGIITIDGNNRVIFMNASAERLFKQPRSAVLGRNVKMLVPTAIRSDHDNMVNRHRTTGVDRIVGTSRDVEIERDDGSSLWVELKLVRVALASGEVTYTAFLRDVSKQRAAIDAAREAIQTVGRASQEIGTYGKAVAALARKTDLLAINASIEAANAGEHGRSFSVIAREVRELASQTSKAAEDINALVENSATDFDRVSKQLADGSAVAPE